MGHRQRDRNGKVALLAADWKFRPQHRQILRWIEVEEGDRLVQAGTAEGLCDQDTGELVAFRLLRECERPRAVAQFHPYKERPLVPIPSSTAFSRPELLAIAGEHFRGGENNLGVYGPPGRSRTARLNDEQRRSRVAKGLREVDLAEAARTKLNLYRSVH